MPASGFLRQSTTDTIKMGPFLDKDDGVSEETGITPVVEISKDNGAFAARNSATAISHDAEGWFDVELDTTDTGTVGRLIAKAHDSATHLPVWHEFHVLEEDIYDALFGSGAAAFDSSDQVTVGSIANGAITAASIASSAITAAKIGSSAITAAKIATDAITSAKIAADAIGASELATDAVEAIADQTWDEAFSGHNTGGTFGQLIRILKEGMFIREGTAQAGANGTITLDSGASATDDFYNFTLILLTGGTGVGQVRLITDYTGSTKVAEVGRDWTTNPDNTSEFQIIVAAESAVKNVIDRVTANTDQIEGSDATDQITTAVEAAVHPSSTELS